MDVWVVSNPGPNAVGCPHPRPSQAEGRMDLQLDGFSFAILTDDEMAGWELSPGFKALQANGLIVVEKTDTAHLPKEKPTMPADMIPPAYDAQVAYQIAFAPETTDDMQFARINLFRSDKPDRVWAPEADLTYLRTRHRKLLVAAQWYLEKFLDTRIAYQDKRLKDIRRQLKAIDTLG